MRLPFLDREQELARLAKALRAPSVTLACIYGRRRLGKSRLLQRVLERGKAVYYVGDDRDAPIQLAAVAKEIGRILPGFDAVRYPGWDELLERWWREAPQGALLALDELPALVRASPELPSVLQKHVDRGRDRRMGILLCGSSQRMMHGLLLDASAPLYGRATEILKLQPLEPAWLPEALPSTSPAGVVEQYLVWGGVPRYWELAADHRDLWSAIEKLVLDPLGVLHREPERLLADDMTEVSRAASILTLVGQGCHRVSEIGGRLGVPSTSLSRPLALLVDLGLLRRDVPFGESARDSKRALYRIGDPLLSFWYRFVEPNRSRLEAGQVADVTREVRAGFGTYVGSAWEQLARDRVAKMRIAGRRWQPASAWWGATRGGTRLELDVVAASVDDPDHVLVGEAKRTCTAAEARQALAKLEREAPASPELQGKRLTFALWVLAPKKGALGERIVTAADVLSGAALPVRRRKSGRDG